jgi:hypothetical protein
MSNPRPDPQALVFGVISFECRVFAHFRAGNAAILQVFALARSLPYLVLDRKEDLCIKRLKPLFWARW